MTNAEKIQAVLNTLETVMIPATADNLTRLTGIYNTLIEVREDLARPSAGEDGEKNV